MGTRFKVDKNILVLIICFCISIITFRLEDLQYIIKYHTFNFYESNIFENIIYEIGTNSVYTVVKDTASEKMLNNKRQAIEIIENYKNIEVFVINNNDKATYSNNSTNSLNEFNKSIEHYLYKLEINFGDNTFKK